MTSASELFYNRRTRLGRSATDLGLFDSSPNINSHHHANRRHQSNHSQNHHRRHGLDGCDPLRRSPFVRHLPPRLPYSYIRRYLCLVAWKIGCRKTSTENATKIVIENLGLSFMNIII